jgi:8-oxo-(d)GTP phosphatase
MAPSRELTAAGGVVWRGRPGAVEIAVIHRARYDDWSLPKGKVKSRESLLNGAVREVAEELAARVAVSRRIGSGRYLVGGVRKTVTYWVMRWLDDDGERDLEVDDVVWLAPNEARRRLTYDLDRAVVSDFAAIPVPEAVVVLVRHAKAGKRSEWRGDDARRPPDVTGEQQAARLVGLLSYFAPTRVVSANRTRCEQTVEPLARALKLPVETDPTFADENLRPRATANALLALAKPGSVTVVCSQGVTIPTLISELVPDDRVTDTRKATAWVLTIVDGDVVTADYYDDAIR